jgi:signal transduction histidine kinase
LHNAPESDQHLNSQAHDRLALATRLHETLAQDLALLGYRIDELIADTSLSRHQRSALREIRISIIEVNKRFRDAIYLSKPSNRAVLEEKIGEILEGRFLDIDLSFPLLKDREEVLLGEALMEMARNTARHANAKTFHISYAISETELTIFVRDDGAGISPISKPNLGIRIIDNNLKELCTSYTCESDSSGTRYSLHIDTGHVESSPHI